MTDRHRYLRARRRWLGILILMLGWGGATLLFCTAQPASSPGGADALSAPLAPEDFKGYARAVETVGGSLWVLAGKARRWIETLPTEYILAGLLALGTTLVAIGFLRAARPVNTVLDGDADSAARTAPEQVKDETRAFKKP